VPSTKAINIFFVHGNTGYPSKNWYFWLRDEPLKKFEGYTLNIIIPHFPTELSDGMGPSPTSETPPDKLSFTYQSRQEWNAVAKDKIKNWTPERTILIGHSLGGLFVHDLAEEQGRAVKEGTATPFAAVIAVAPVGLKGVVTSLTEEAHIYLSTFRDVDPTFIRKGTKSLTVFIGEQDPIVAPADSMDLAKRCGADECIVVKGYGHFWQGEGVTELPIVRDCAIEKINLIFREDLA